MRRAAARSRRCDARFSVVYCILHAQMVYQGGEELACFVCALVSNAHHHHHTSRGRSPVASGAETAQLCTRAFVAPFLWLERRGRALTVPARRSLRDCSAHEGDVRSSRGDTDVRLPQSKLRKSASRGGLPQKALERGKHAKGSPLLEDERRL